MTSKTQSGKRVKVVMVSCCASPAGIGQPGMVVDLPESVAKVWIERRYARAFDPIADQHAPQGLVKYRRDDD